MRWLPRLFVILWIIARYRLCELLPTNSNSDLRMRVIIRLFKLVPADGAVSGQPCAARLRLALQRLGPVHIKFGQLLSTRRDMLPEAIANELALLQDRVEPFCSKRATAIIESALQQTVDQLFSEFDPQPLASASVAQVHAATLPNGEQVVIKVIRPDIEKTISRDLKLLFFIAAVLEKHSGDARRLHLHEVISDYEQVIFSELDLKSEAANASQLKRNFEESEHHDILLVPAIHWDYSTENVLVMERMHGLPISDIAGLNRQQVDLKLLAERGVEIFFTQVFEHNFFHADMHPGNILVDTREAANPRYIALDCAIMGSLPESDRYYMARVLLAALDRDYRLVAKLYDESGWIKPGTNLIAFESLIRSVCEPIFSRPLSELRVGTLLIYLFRAARRFGMELQPSLVLLQKTIINVEGLGQQLYPQLDLWQTAQPFLAKWVRARYSPRRLLDATENHLPALIESLPALLDTLPALTERLTSDLGGDSKYSSHQDPQLHKRLEALEARSQKLQKLNVTLVVIAILCLTGYFV
jgi:ubiquinone biosynthesis protein